ncbi:MAG: hypothetical protein PHQ05_11615 [Sterolibacterium sp.]|nr:hypothetical protein [Sterolibacterium sp.]
MNKRTSIFLVALLGFSAIAFAQAPAATPATPVAQGASATTVPHDVKPSNGKATKKKGHAHHKHARASASTNK